MQRLHVEWSGITLACSDWWASIVRLQISVWGGKRQREDGYYVAKRKMLCWATKQKVSDSLFPIQSAARRAGSRQCHGSGASLTPVVVVVVGWGGDLLRARQWLVSRGHCELCGCGREVEACSPGVVHSAQTWSRLFSRDMYIRKTGGRCTAGATFSLNQSGWKFWLLNMTGGGEDFKDPEASYRNRTMCFK